MTGDDIFRMALSLMNESYDNADGYLEYVLDILNRLLGENLEVINSLLLWYDKPVLTAPIQIDSLEQKIEIDNAVLFNVKNLIANGLCMFLMLGDDEMSKASFFSVEYESCRQKAGKCITTPTGEENWYGRV